jgi:uncharacterized protein (TIRG00374 family)
VFGVASLAVGYAIRIFRWSVILGAAGASATWKNCAAPFLGSIALNNVLPLRMGDIVRAFVFPAAMGIRRTIAASSLVMERLIDLMTLLACLAIAVVATQSAHLPVLIKESAITMSIVGGLAMTLGFLFSGSLARVFQQIALGRKGHLSRWLVVASTLLHSFEAMSQPRVLFSVIGISMLVWIGESGLFYFVLAGFGLDADPMLAMLVMAIATLSTLLPSSPGYVGPFHLAVFTTVSMLGATSAQAGSCAVLVHLALWLPTTIIGAIAIWMRPALFRADQTNPISKMNST